MFMAIHFKCNIPQLHIYILKHCEIIMKIKMLYINFQTDTICTESNGQHYNNVLPAVSKTVDLLVLKGIVTWVFGEYPHA